MMLLAPLETRLRWEVAQTYLSLKRYQEDSRCPKRNTAAYELYKSVLVYKYIS